VLILPLCLQNTLFIGCSEITQCLQNILFIGCSEITQKVTIMTVDFIAFLLKNWDTITLIITNIGALFMQPPFKKK
jgi:hypothetical protein